MAKQQSLAFLSGEPVKEFFTLQIEQPENLGDREWRWRSRVIPVTKKKNEVMYTVFFTKCIVCIKTSFFW